MNIALSRNRGDTPPVRTFYAVINPAFKVKSLMGLFQPLCTPIIPLNPSRGEEKNQDQ